jgi:hypothetical protein
MKAINDTTAHLRTQIVEWFFVKGPELFVTIYGK